MRVERLINELLTRLGELEWTAKSAQFIIFPSRYPKGLFRATQGHASTKLDAYIDEIKTDSLSLKSLSYEQATFRAEKIYKKISVLTNALASQKKQRASLNRVDALVKQAASRDKTIYQYLKEEASNSTHEDHKRMLKALKELKASEKKLKGQSTIIDTEPTKQQLRLQSIQAEIRYIEQELAKK